MIIVDDVDTSLSDQVLDEFICKPTQTMDELTNSFEYLNDSNKKRKSKIYWHFSKCFFKGSISIERVANKRFLIKQEAFQAPSDHVFDFSLARQVQLE
jgi:hypothetical protein